MTLRFLLFLSICISSVSAGESSSVYQNQKGLSRACHAILGFFGVTERRAPGAISISDIRDIVLKYPLAPDSVLIVHLTPKRAWVITNELVYALSIKKKLDMGYSTWVEVQDRKSFKISSGWFRYRSSWPIDIRTLRLTDFGTIGLLNNVIRGPLPQSGWSTVFEDEIPQDLNLLGLQIDTFNAHPHTPSLNRTIRFVATLGAVAIGSIGVHLSRGFVHEYAMRHTHINLEKNAEAMSEWDDWDTQMLRVALIDGRSEELRDLLNSFRRSKVWNSAMWNAWELIAEYALTNHDLEIRLAAVDTLMEPHADWSPRAWDLILNTLLISEDLTTKYRCMIAMRTQQNWPERAWELIPSLVLNRYEHLRNQHWSELGVEELRASGFEAVLSQNEWSPTFLNWLENWRVAGAENPRDAARLKYLLKVRDQKRAAKRSGP